MLARNQRTPLGELDLICRDRSEMVIVEVKSRSGDTYGTALEAIGTRKVRRIKAGGGVVAVKPGSASMLRALRRSDCRSGRAGPPLLSAARQRRAGGVIG